MKELLNYLWNMHTTELLELIVVILIGFAIPLALMGVLMWFKIRQWHKTERTRKPDPRYNYRGGRYEL
jgi:uncharacterized membrane protein YidH (DUF202 family)